MRSVRVLSSRGVCVGTVIFGLVAGLFRAQTARTAAVSRRYAAAGLKCDRTTDIPSYMRESREHLSHARLASVFIPHTHTHLGCQHYGPKRYAVVQCLFVLCWAASEECGGAAWAEG